MVRMLFASIFPELESETVFGLVGQYGFGVDCACLCPHEEAPLCTG